MRILAIETSCDDTGIAVLEIRNSMLNGRQAKFEIKSNVVSSQIEVHKQYGGVFPMMAKREHQNNLVPVLKKALKQAKLLNQKSRIKNQKQIPNSKFQIINSILERESELSKQFIPFLEKCKKPDIDLITVTNGPGLEPCLWVGINFAKVLSYFWEIPVIPVNHIEAHILVNFLNFPIYRKLDGRQVYSINFPAIALVVSGGHTQLILVKGIGKYKIIGETRDDAAGECFDKCAKILGLGYPGGPIISKIATEASANARRPQANEGRASAQLPRPMMNTKDYDFSFSGLKTAVLYKTRDRQQETRDKKFIEGMCVEIQQAIIDVLIKKTLKAAKDFKAKTVILGGGVSANSELRLQLKSRIMNNELRLNLLVPPANLSTDNALMIAVTGYFSRNKKVAWQKLSANANLRV